MATEFFKEKSWLLSLLLALFAVLVAASVRDLLATLAIAAAAFMFGYPILSTRRAWQRREDAERWVQVIVSALPFPMAIWVLASSLVDKGFAFTTESFEWVGGDVVIAFAFVLFVSYIPRWQRQRKACPECCEVARSEARVCPHCNFRWQAPLDQDEV